jgi:cell division transport system permease protein
MHRISHAFRRAMDALVRAPTVTAVAIGTIYVAILLTGALAAALEPGARLLAGWSSDVPVTVFLRDGADLEAARAAARALAPDAVVDAIPPAQAMRTLRASLGAQAGVLDGLADEVLPPSLEVRLPALTHARALSLATRLRDVPGVAAVDDGALWVARLEELMARVRQAGLILLAILGAATAVLVSNTLKLAVYARRDEIEIMKLVGATDLYVGAPILLEGAIHGLAGAALALASLAAAVWVLLPRLRAAVPIASPLTPGDVLPGRLVAALVVSGILLGVVASAIALRRFLRRPGG